jgi:hypothetical protein
MWGVVLTGAIVKLTGSFGQLVLPHDRFSCHQDVIPDSCGPGDSRPGSVEGGRRPSPEATHSALDGFRATPDNREAGMSHPES